MRLRSLMDSPSGLRFFIDELCLHSSVSRSLLLESEMSCSELAISKTYAELSEFLQLFVKENQNITQNIAIKMSGLRDIRTTISRIKSHSKLDDIELFEVKNLAILNESIDKLIRPLSLRSVILPDLSDVLLLLDPEGQRVTSFFVYDCYSEELRELRKKIERSSDYLQELQYKAAILEDEIRAKLSGQLFNLADQIEESLLGLAKIDTLIAKALQIDSLQLSIPIIAQEQSSFKSLFNPEIAEALQKNKREYQAVDITFSKAAPLLITGANMGGKTVVLKTLALSQYLFQFGFGIPAKEACIVPVEELYFCIGDEQDSIRGISSFAAEIIRIDKAIKAINKGTKVLALIDEPARTTNPYEGTALVSALINIMRNKPASVVITTHYNVKNNDCRKVRVVGLQNGEMNYALTEDNSGTAPREALAIAESLGVDNEWLSEAKKLYSYEDEK